MSKGYRFKEGRNLIQVFSNFHEMHVMNFRPPIHSTDHQRGVQKDLNLINIFSKAHLRKNFNAIKFENLFEPKPKHNVNITQ